MKYASGRLDYYYYHSRAHTHTHTHTHSHTYNNPSHCHNITLKWREVRIGGWQ